MAQLNGTSIKWVQVGDDGNLYGDSKSLVDSKGRLVCGMKFDGIGIH